VPLGVPLTLFTDTLNTIGSVAVIKLPLLISSFAQYSNLSIRVILTKAAHSKKPIKKSREL
jgi:hypothetical protein